MRILLALLLVLVPLPANAAPAHTVTYDQYSIRIDDQPVYIWSAEFHYFRLPSPDLWRDVLEKTKAAGFNAVSLYFAWNYHSPRQGEYDFTGIRDVERLLRMTEELGLYVIARPGPYINAEISGGGFPAWTKTRAGVNRTSEPEYMEAAREWMSRINPIIARHQLTKGTGNVILYQVENEYQGGRQDADYMETLKEWARADGITVPTFVNDGGPNRNWVRGKGAPDIYGFDAYPQGFDCTNPDGWRNLPDYTHVDQFKPETPLIMPEAQGGAFDGWGGSGFDNCRQLTGSDFTRVFTKMSLAAGVSMMNFYMTFGGTNFGWLGDPNAGYTSYDYGAPISESRHLADKYTEFKRLGYLLRSVTPLARTALVEAPAPSDPALRIDKRVSPDTGTEFYFVRHADTRDKGTHQTTVSVAGHDVTVPIAGRDAKLLVAGYDLGAQRLVYSTSEILTHAQIGAKDVAILYGRSGESGETVLRYASEPKVRVLSGEVRSSWSNGELKLSYPHSQARVLIEGGARPLELVLGSDAEAGKWWRHETASGPVLVRGPYLVRSAAVAGGVLKLTGDTERAGSLDVIAPPTVQKVTWNGGASQHPRPVVLPSLTGWRYQEGMPESQVDFDDSTWTTASRLTANHPTLAGSTPVLAADEYGFHWGDVWYRGRFRAAGGESTLNLNAITGNRGVFSVWLNGSYVGSGGQLPVVLRDGENTLAVLVENMGMNEEWGHDFSKEPRGLLSASLAGRATTITWKIQGTRHVDGPRGPFNNGGLYGERAGWHLPGFRDREWARVSLPDQHRAPGVHWYRTNVRLDLPHSQDNSIGVRLTDDPAKHYRVQLFVNGWLVGRYVNDVGPQHDFVVPQGILHHNGDNTIALAVWTTDGSGPRNPQLVDFGARAGGVPVRPVPAGNWSPRLHTIASPDARLSVTSAAFRPTEVTTTFIAVTQSRDVRLNLSAPAGWQVQPATPVSFPVVAPGATVSARWTVVPPASAPYTVLEARAEFRARGDAKVLTEPRAVQVPKPEPTGEVYVSDLEFARESNGWGPVERDRSNGEGAAGDGAAITIGGFVFAKGLGVHPASDVRVYLGGGCTTFTATVGVDDEVGDSGSVVFSVVGDDAVRHTSAVVRGTDGGVPLSVDVTGVHWLDLVVSDSGDNPWSDHADWGSARLSC